MYRAGRGELTRRPGAASVVTAMAVVAPAWAPPTSAVGDELPALEAYQVRALRTSDDPGRVPASVQLIDRTRIERSAAADLADLLGREMGLHIRRLSGHTGQAEVDLRGAGENSGLRTLVVVDGHRLNRPDLGGLDWLAVPLSSVERVEVVRGAQSALYGNHAVNGVIVVTTRDEGSAAGGQLSASAGSYGEEHLRLNYGGSEGEAAEGSNPNAAGPLRYAINAGRDRAEGYRDNSRYRSRSAGFDLGSPLGPRLSLDGGVGWVEDERQFPGGLFSVDFPGEDPGAPGVGPRDSVNAASEAMGERVRVHGTAAWEDGLGEAARLATGYSRRDLRSDFEGIFSDSVLESLTLSPQWERRWDRWRAGAGVDLAADRLRHEGFADPRRTRTTNRARLGRRLAGAFTHLQFRPSERLTWTGAARWEQARVDARNRDFGFVAGGSFKGEVRHRGLSGSVGLAYRPGPSTRFFLRLDRVYHYPALDELAAFQGFPLSEPFNANLDPETGVAVEAGTVWESGSWRLAGTVFARQTEGEIGFDPARSLNVNLGDTGRGGVEVDLRYRRGGWEVAAGYEAVAAAFRGGSRDGAEVPLVPPHRWRLRVARDLGGGFQLRVNASHTAASREGGDTANARRKVPGYSLAGLALHWDQGGSWRAFLALDNAFDRGYASAKFNGLWYPEPGRTARAGLTYRF